jgi:hypothetical protein
MAVAVSIDGGTVVSKRDEIDDLFVGVLVMV